MKIPRNADSLSRFAKETIDECLVSRDLRRQAYSMWRRVFYTGSDNGTAAKHNKIFSHVDKLSSYLFSPSEVRFSLDFEGADSPIWKTKAEVGARYLNRLFSRREVDTAFAEANLWALVKGCAILRVNWGRNGFEPWVIQPDRFGVRNESIPDLNRQDAFVLTTLLTEAALKRLLTNSRDQKDVMRLVGSAFDAASSALVEDTWMGGDITGLGNFNAGGGIAIPGISTASPAGQGSVDMISAPPSAMLAPEVQSRLIELHELWVWNDEQEDWSTIQYVDPGILLEGKYQLRNVHGPKQGHPFVRVCSNEVPDYFWGRSEIANVWKTQSMLNGRIDNVDKMYRLNAEPPRVFRGFSGLTEAKARALLSPSAILTDGAPSGTTSVDTMKTEIPQGYLQYISTIEAWFDEAGGFTAMTNGQGEPGVRAGVHANTLLRTSTPRLRDRALLVEKQVAKAGEVCFNLLEAKDPTVLQAEVGRAGSSFFQRVVALLKGGESDEIEEFTLSQLPDDCSVVVDSHTSSPAFSGEAEQKAFMLHRSNAIDNIDLIRLTHVPNEDRLVENERERQKDHAKLMAELRKADPEAWAKAMSGGHRR